MGLPKLQNTLQYEMTIPSSGKKVRYRPFLVKEEKNLMIAMESKDTSTIIHTLLAILLHIINVISLTWTYQLTSYTFYIFCSYSLQNVAKNQTIKYWLKHLKCFTSLLSFSIFYWHSLGNYVMQSLFFIIFTFYFATANAQENIQQNSSAYVDEALQYYYLAAAQNDIALGNNQQATKVLEKIIQEKKNDRLLFLANEMLATI